MRFSSLVSSGAAAAALVASPASATATEQHHHLAPRQRNLPESRQFSHGEGYVNDVLYHHNVHRSNHSAPDLQYHFGLADTAEKIARTCKFEHILSYDGGEYGQNIAAGIPWQDVGVVISDFWYNKELPYYSRLYGIPNPTFQKRWGHFTQMVWKQTTHVGCFTQHCPNGVKNAPGTYDYTVCNYRRRDPTVSGNTRGQYAKNVGKPRGQETIRGNRGS
ncbi:hypothetical protein CERZMDRAFT_89152 [Cercospora zeae-maydis SCOH1-5]|uniref:SCP domain-containing protein n=1 Tax=Cercospora zeae-maydis SCOH1-5 TaxID=717836 RepID=A0A6A6EYV5_9PEZI|nr:hypothetical protein CERZMDRAFT_89152 [Cercospora zeae-maydis SCOH1-5]